MADSKPDAKEALALADAVVRAYGQALEVDADVLMPESVLPCDKELIKAALLVCLGAHVAAGTFDKGRLHQFLGPFLSLANFVDAPTAAAWREWSSATQAARTAPLDGARHLLGRVVGSPIPAVLKESEERARALLIEFNERFRSMLGMPGGATSCDDMTARRRE